MRKHNLNGSGVKAANGHVGAPSEDLQKNVAGFAMPVASWPDDVDDDDDEDLEDDELDVDEVEVEEEVEVTEDPDVDDLDVDPDLDDDDDEIDDI